MDAWKVFYLALTAFYFIAPYKKKTHVKKNCPFFAFFFSILLRPERTMCLTLLASIHLIIFDLNFSSLGILTVGYAVQEP